MTTNGLTNLPNYEQARIIYNLAEQGFAIAQKQYAQKMLTEAEYLEATARHSAAVALFDNAMRGLTGAQFRHDIRCKIGSGNYP